MSYVGLAPAGPAGVNRIAAAARGFSPNWFTATMGTGGLSLVLHAAPIALPGREALATGLWVFNIGLFAAMSALYAAQWLFYPQEARRALHHPVMSMFFGAIPMGLATIVNGFIAYAPPVWAIPVAEPLWWFDVALSVLCGLAVPYLMFTRHEHRLERMTAVWLIPIVAAEVAAASGALLAPHLDAERAYLVVLDGLRAVGVLCAAGDERAGDPVPAAGAARSAGARVRRFGLAGAGADRHRGARAPPARRRRAGGLRRAGSRRASAKSPRGLASSAD